MLEHAHRKGVEDALARFGLKTAGIMGDVQRGLIGEPGRLFTEGAKSFQPGGLLHWKNVFWPSQYGLIGNTLGRLGTIAMPLSVMHAMRSNPHEGMLSNALGAIGGAAGSLYGGMGGGMLGFPVGGAIGSRLGHGIGHLLGSHPKDQFQ